MIEHELLLLGLLKESPRHGYEIKTKVKEILSLFAGVDLKSIYYPLKVLEKKGLLLKHATKHGRRPERLVYTLTPKGENRFEELLTKSLLDFKRPQFSLDLSLYFLRYMKRDIARRRLLARMHVLKKLSASLTQLIKNSHNKKPPSLVYILEHDLEMVNTEFEFLKRITKVL